MASRTLIVYFSQAGSTRKVAHAIADGLRRQGHQVDLHHLLDGSPPPLDGYDVLGVGFPVYFWRPPFPIGDYLDALPQLGGLPHFVFVQSAGLEGDAAATARRMLNTKGGREVGVFRAMGPDHLLALLRRGRLLAADHPTPAELAAANAFGVNVARRIAGAEYAEPPPERPPTPLFRLVRFAMHRWLTRHLYSRGFAVRADLCTACGTCTDVCPTANITPDRHGRPLWGRDCLVCGFCDLRCPAEAIRSPLRWRIFTPFVALGERAALANPLTGSAPVAIAQGQVVRLDRPHADPDATEVAARQPEPRSRSTR